MIILDTNVVSELMRTEPNASVLAWTATQPRHLLYTTYINQIEIFYGVAALPEGKRRTVLTKIAEAIFSEDFTGRILSFGAAAASHYPNIVIQRRRAGKPIEGFDALIAAIAVASDAQIATRDTDGFANCGVSLIDPWKA